MTILNILHKTHKFSGGEIHFTLNANDFMNTRSFIVRLNNSDDVMELLMFNEKIKYYASDFYLTIPYLPYGRQDKLSNENEVLSLRVMANLLNNLCFKGIYTYDCHSPVTNALIPKLIEKKQSSIVKAATVSGCDGKYWGEPKILYEILDQSVIIAPDAGAVKKIYETADHYKRPIAIANKTRDPITGTITDINIDVKGDSAFIIDDICDGGRTFIELAKALRSQGFKKVYLYVTHGIFANGLDVFDGLIDHIFTTNTFKEQDEHPLLTTYKVI